MNRQPARSVNNTHPGMNLAERTQVTFQLEQRRAISNGILETAGTTFLVLTVVKGFGESGPIAKALVATAASVGLLLTPVIVTGVQSLRLPVWRSVAPRSFS